jgi:hypothetical protein
MDDAMKIRDLNFRVTCLQNGLRIEKNQALVAYKENNKLKIEVDRLQTLVKELTPIDWISVKDSLPLGVSDNYLAFRPKAPGSKVCSLWYDTQHNGWSGVFTVSHWSVLPEGPLGDSKKPIN